MRVRPQFCDDTLLVVVLSVLLRGPHLAGEGSAGAVGVVPAGGF